MIRTSEPSNGKGDLGQPFRRFHAADRVGRIVACGNHAPSGDDGHGAGQCGQLVGQRPVDVDTECGTGQQRHRVGPHGGRGADANDLAQRARRRPARRRAARRRRGRPGSGAGRRSAPDRSRARSPSSTTTRSRPPPLRRSPPRGAPPRGGLLRIGGPRPRRARRAPSRGARRRRVWPSAVWSCMARSTDDRMAWSMMFRRVIRPARGPATVSSGRSSAFRRARRRRR